MGRAVDFEPLKAPRGFFDPIVPVRSYGWGTFVCFDLSSGHLLVERCLLGVGINYQNHIIRL